MCKVEIVCVDSDNPDWFTKGKSYFSKGLNEDGCYKVIDDQGDPLHIRGDNMTLDLNYCTQFKIVEDSVATTEESCGPCCDKPMSPQSTKDALQIATLRSIQEQCSRANLSISIDPEGFNIFDCDTDMQTMVHSVAEVVEILETKLEYKDSMGKWGWL